MTMSPPSGGAMLDHHSTVMWALVPAAFSGFGLIAALVALRSKP
jgi:hypothetical protein